jgi:D-arabinose 1-dehydrogenase-like Zn-dependent alcohol dehydrogenase
MKLVLNGPGGLPTTPTLAPDGAPPAPRPDQVIVDMAWGSLNRIDRLLCDGRVPRPAGQHVLGGQGAGYVTALGSEVEGLELGQLVALYPYGGCGDCERCATGNETLCRRARLDGVNAPGTFQAYFAADARDAFAAPATLTASMAALGSTMAVAWHVLVCRGGLRRGETVAISSMSSGLGACCGALADLLGAHVIGVARRDTLAALRSVPSWASATYAVDEEPAGRPPRVDLAVDAVGAPTLPVVHRLVKVGGRMVTVGAHAGDRCALDIWRLFTREQDLRGSHGCHRPDMTEALSALRELDESELVDSVFDIADHQAAYERLDTPGRLGNILINLSAEGRSAHH